MKNPEKAKKYKAKYSEEHPEAIRYSQLKWKMKIRNDEVLSREAFFQWYKNEPKKCFYCGIPEDLVWINNLGRGERLRRKGLTIDRRNGNQGYVQGNIVLACFLCNTLKSNYFTAEEFNEIAQTYIKPRWQKEIEDEH